MTICVEEIAGKLYRWSVPPGFTKAGSRKFFFWTSFAKDLTEKNLDGEWITELKKSKLYKTKCRSVVKISRKINTVY